MKRYLFSVKDIPAGYVLVMSVTRDSFIVRAPTDLVGWAKTNARQLGFQNRNHMMVACLEAARDGRLAIRPPNPQAFPADVEKTSGKLEDLTAEEIAALRSLLHKLENRHE